MSEILPFDDEMRRNAEAHNRHERWTNMTPDVKDELVRIRRALESIAAALEDDKPKTVINRTVCAHAVTSRVSIAGGYATQCETCKEYL